VDFWKKLVKDPTRLEVLGDGHQKKSYLNVADCVRSMFTAIEKARENINVLNLGHTEWLEVNESIRIITRTMNVSPRLEYTGGERGWVGDSPRILLDTKRIRSLGWAPAKSIEESVVETLRFLMEIGLQRP
jgi:UDP-glucose 4-epimerase